MKNKYLSIAFTSITLIAIELSWTRIFSAEFFYTFAFLILSTAVLGLGLGALSVRLFKLLNRERVFSLALSFAALSALIGPIIVFQIKIDFSQLYLSWFMMFKLVILIIILSSSFFFGGIALTLLFKWNSDSIPKLYMADMCGAGFGVLFAVLLMNWIGTPATASLLVIPILFVAFVHAKGLNKIFPSLLLIASIIISFFSSDLFELERKDRGKVLLTHWDALSKIRVVEYNELTRGIRIDNAAQTSVYRFTGDFKNTKFKFDVNIANLIHRFDSCTFLSLGAGGGVDVLHALQENASEVHAVEINPFINHLLLDGALASYTGHVYKDPKVKVITEDARTYVRRFNNKFDIILGLSSNSFAALASGAFALAENYLFTTEAFVDYLNALTSSGFIIMEHHFYVPRMLSEAIDALREIGIDNPQNHIIVYELPKLHRNVIIVSKKAITKDLVENALGKTYIYQKNYHYPVYPAPDSVEGNLFNYIVLSGWENIKDDIPFDISPCTDDKPFIAQMGKWENLDLSALDKMLPFEYFGFPLSRLNILVIILVILFLIIPINLIPYFRKGEKLKFVPWLYFFAIGMAFMMVEIVLIQKYTLFIGASVYSIITILLTLLLASGIGSGFAEKINDRLAFGGIIIWILLEVFVFKYLTNSLGGLELAPRIIISFLLIAPLGFFMGIPFPKAGMRVGKLIDWGFAVNGAASVLGSTLILLIAFSYGFSVSLLVGALVYLSAGLLFSLKKKW